MHLVGFITITYHDAGHLNVKKKFEKLVHLVGFITITYMTTHGHLNVKNKFEKLVHLVGFITITYHDARSSERQKRNLRN